VAALTLLQRTVPNDVLARVFGILETLALGAIALGAALAPVLIGAVGTRPTLVVTGAFLPVVTALLWRQILALDDEAAKRRPEVELLSGIPAFAPLPELSIEALASDAVVATRLATLRPASASL
jgi:hypothetical protein